MEKDNQLFGAAGILVIVHGRLLDEGRHLIQNRKLFMSRFSSASGAGNFVTLESRLLVLTVILVLSHAVAYYILTHIECYVEALLINLALVVLGVVVAIFVGARIGVLVFWSVFRQRCLMSPWLLVSAALFAIYFQTDKAHIFYVMDQFRFHMNRSAYLAEVERSNSSPKFVVNDWGGSEFLAWRIRHFLVFDENNSIARGLADPMDMPLPNENIKCDTSVRPLRGSFYSVTVYCEPT